MTTFQAKFTQPNSDSKEYGGLRVRKLREFNVDLLGKWCWRLLTDKGGLWYRVLVARYGEEAGRLEVGGQSVSIWWRVMDIWQVNQIQSK